MNANESMQAEREELERNYDKVMRAVVHAQEDRDRWRREFDMERAKVTRLEHEAERLRGALTHLMAFGKRLMNSEVMEERAIGCCICEGARIIEEDS